MAALLEQAEASPVDEMDQIKIIGRLQENYRALEFLREWAKTISPVTAHKAQEIMALRPAGDNLSERLDSCRRRVELLLLSHPSGREFWGLARVLMKDIVAELQQADAHAAAALRQWRDTIHWVAPSWVFEDQSTDGANSKYSYRPIAVKRIVPGGLPGQGRR